MGCNFYAGWWQLTLFFVIFTPIPGEMIQFDGPHIFRMGAQGRRQVVKTMSLAALIDDPEKLDMVRSLEIFEDWSSLRHLPAMFGINPKNPATKEFAGRFIPPF